MKDLVDRMKDSKTAKWTTLGAGVLGAMFSPDDVVAQNKALDKPEPTKKEAVSKDIIPSFQIYLRNPGDQKWRYWDSEELKERGWQLPFSLDVQD